MWKFVAELRVPTNWYSVFSDALSSALLDLAVEYTLRLSLVRSVKLPRSFCLFVLTDLVTLKFPKDMNLGLPIILPVGMT